MRERFSLDRNWRFALGHAADPSRDFEFARDRSLVKAGEARGAAGVTFDDSGWRTINVPHDWAIELPLDPKGDKELCEHGFHAIGPDHPEASVGWYRRTFEIPKSDLGRRISIEFDGVFRDSVAWINGHRMGRHESGYTSFRCDLTDVLNYGGQNVVAVRVDATCYEGWWYEGAGIYRHVWLVKTAPLHVAPQGTFVIARPAAAGGARLNLRTSISNDGDAMAGFDLDSRIVDAAGKTIAQQRSRRLFLAAGASMEIVQRIKVKRARLWSCDHPNIYRLRSMIRARRQIRDLYVTTFGIRSLRWDSKRGFFLNGKSIKIKGTCNHQCHAGVGVAMPNRLHELRLEKLKEMGCNAYRCSHYPVAPEFLDACDRLGFLVMAETRRAGTAPEVLGQFRKMILRDRNHPSIILWSIGNEEHTIQWAQTGERIARTMVRLAHQLDPTRKVTAAMHDRGLAEGFANVVDVHGWNYINVGDIESFHRRRPRQPIIGSEQGSTVTTRGIYTDDATRGYVSAYDRRAPKWGATAEAWWSFFAARPWLAGGFAWTGFDYFGEPIPYKWPCTASHFGLMDLCGFPKDIYYYYRAWWRDEPILHLMPHWNWLGREGHEIDVRAFSNADEVELLLNNRSHGRKAVVRNSHVAWKVPFEPGQLSARGYRGGRQVCQAVVETIDEPARIVLVADRDTIRADGQDLAAITTSVIDSKGRRVPTAQNVITFEVSGAGHLLGVGNGDPSSHEPHKGPHRRLFNGLAMALVQSELRAGRIVLTARSPGLRPARLVLQARAAASAALVV